MVVIFNRRRITKLTIMVQFTDVCVHVCVHVRDPVPVLVPVRVPVCVCLCLRLCLCVCYPVISEVTNDRIMGTSRTIWLRRDKLHWPWARGSNFTCAIFEHIIVIYTLDIYYRIILRRMPHGLTDDRSTMIHAVSRCARHQVINHLNQRWASSVMPYRVTKGHFSRDHLQHIRGDSIGSGNSSALSRWHASAGHTSDDEDTSALTHWGLITQNCISDHSSLDWAITSRLFGTKPLLAPTVIYQQLDTQKHKSVNFFSIRNFYKRKWQSSALWYVSWL